MNKQRIVPFGEAVIRFWKKWSCQEGRASRSEYWFALFFVSLCNLAKSLIVLACKDWMSSDGVRVTNILFLLVFLIPLLSLTSRRLHDVGKSALWMLAWVAPMMLSEIVAAATNNSWLADLNEGFFSDMVVFNLILGTLALIGGVVHLFLTTKPSKKAINAYGPIPNMPEGYGNICPNCGLAIPEIADFCPECGTRIEKISLERKPLEEDNDSTNDVEKLEQPYKCKFCGTTVDDNDILCPKCGARIKRYFNQGEDPHEEVIDTKVESSSQEKVLSQEGQEDTKNALDKDATSTNIKVIVAVSVLAALCGIGNYFQQSMKDSNPAPPGHHATSRVSETKPVVAHDVSSNGATETMTEEFRRILSAARNGDANAQNSVGVGYYNGSGVEKNLSQAAYWIRKAADQGNSMAELNLGQLYLNGEGVPRDAATAVLWLTKAAEQEVAAAQSLLSECYEKGIGVRQDMQKAMEWSIKAVTSSALGR